MAWRGSLWLGDVGLALLVVRYPCVLGHSFGFLRPVSALPQSRGGGIFGLGRLDFQKDTFAHTHICIDTSLYTFVFIRFLYVRLVLIGFTYISNDT